MSLLFHIFVTYPIIESEKQPDAPLGDREHIVSAFEANETVSQNDLLSKTIAIYY